MRYPLATNGIFRTIQGEGHLLGVPMVFIRLAGCSVGCPECDTDYSVSERIDAQEIAQRVAGEMLPGMRWIWITGGEPTDHDIAPLLLALRRIPLVNIAMATAGTKKQPWPRQPDPARPDYLSISPHDLSRWEQRTGHELKIVPGLNGLRMEDVARELERGAWFGHYFVQPLAGSAESLRQCIQWVETHTHSPEWRLTVQAHKSWRLP